MSTHSVDDVTGSNAKAIKPPRPGTKKAQLLAKERQAVKPAVVKVRVTAPKATATLQNPPAPVKTKKKLRGKFGPREGDQKRLKEKQIKEKQGRSLTPEAKEMPKIDRRADKELENQRKALDKNDYDFRPAHTRQDGSARWEDRSRSQRTVTPNPPANLSKEFLYKASQMLVGAGKPYVALSDKISSTQVLDPAFDYLVRSLIPIALKRMFRNDSTGEDQSARELVVFNVLGSADYLNAIGGALVRYKALFGWKVVQLHHWSNVRRSLSAAGVDYVYHDVDTTTSEVVLVDGRILNPSTAPLNMLIILNSILGSWQEKFISSSYKTVFNEITVRNPVSEFGYFGSPIREVTWQCARVYEEHFGVTYVYKAIKLARRTYDDWHFSIAARRQSPVLDSCGFAIGAKGSSVLLVLDTVQFGDEWVDWPNNKIFGVDQFTLLWEKDPSELTDSSPPPSPAPEPMPAKYEEEVPKELFDGDQASILDILPAFVDVLKQDIMETVYPIYEQQRDYYFPTTPQNNSEDDLDEETSSDKGKEEEDVDQPVGEDKGFYQLYFHCNKCSTVWVSDEQQPILCEVCGASPSDLQCVDGVQSFSHLNDSNGSSSCVEHIDAPVRNKNGKLDPVLPVPDQMQRVQTGPTTPVEFVRSKGKWYFTRAFMSWLMKCGFVLANSAVSAEGASPILILSFFLFMSCIRRRFFIHAVAILAYIYSRVSLDPKFVCERKGRANLTPEQRATMTRIVANRIQAKPLEPLNISSMVAAVSSAISFESPAVDIAPDVVDAWKTVREATQIDKGSSWMWSALVGCGVEIASWVVPYLCSSVAQLAISAVSCVGTAVNPSALNSLIAPFYEEGLKSAISESAIKLGADKHRTPRAVAIGFAIFELVCYQPTTIKDLCCRIPPFIMHIAIANNALHNRIAQHFGYNLAAVAIELSLRKLMGTGELSANALINIRAFRQAKLGDFVPPICTRLQKTKEIRRGNVLVRKRQTEEWCRHGQAYHLAGPYITTHVPFCFRACEHNMMGALTSRMAGTPKIFAVDDSEEHRDRVDAAIIREFASTHVDLLNRLNAMTFPGLMTNEEWCSRFPPKKCLYLMQAWIERALEIKTAYDCFVKKEKSVVEDEVFETMEIDEDGAPLPCSVKLDPRGISVPHEAVRVETGPWCAALNKHMHAVFTEEIYYNPGASPLDFSQWFYKAIHNVLTGTWEYALAVQGDDSLLIRLCDGVLMILSADMSRYDMSQRVEHFRQVWVLLGQVRVSPPEDVKEIIMRQQGLFGHPHVYKAGFAKIQVKGTMPSGDGVTITFNSLILLQALLAYVKNHLSSHDAFEDVMSTVGFCATYTDVPYDLPLRVDFLQSRPWLVSDGRRVFAPKPGRICARFFWVDRKYIVRDKYIAEARTLTLGLISLASHVPILNDICIRILDLTKDVRALRRGLVGPEELQRWYTGSYEEEHPETVCEMAALYQLDVGDILEARVRCREWTFDEPLDSTPELSRIFRAIARVDLA